MTDAIDIVQPLNDEQKKDITDALSSTRKRDYRYKTEKELEAYQREVYEKEKKPFCYTCAKKDLKAAQDEAFKHPSNRQKYGTERNTVVKVDKKEYESPKRFKLLKDEYKETKDGRGRIEKTWYKTYECNVRGCRQSVVTKEESS